jgi:hypothetical protein
VLLRVVLQFASDDVRNLRYYTPRHLTNYAGHIVFQGKRTRGNSYVGIVFKMEEINMYRIFIRKSLEKSILRKVRKILSITLVL